MSTTGSLASTLGVDNPYRYRGYRYDNETGLYYLQSRYYNPSWGRFVNADGQIGSSDVPGDLNLFSYCRNNPVMYVDHNGLWAGLGSLVNGLVCVAIGVVAIGVVVATGGIATPLVAVGLAAVATAGSFCVITGTYDVYESFTGTNVLKDAIGESTYTEAQQIAMIVSIVGTEWAIAQQANPGDGSGNVTNSSSQCFVAGTQVLTASGIKNIEDIEPGDQVWAENPKTGEIGIKRVVQTFVNESDELVRIFVAGEEIICTPEHPFYSPIKGWIGAMHLRAGDVLLTSNGKQVIVEAIQHELLENPIEVYNFEVKEYHTYFIGQSFILVHNSCNHTSSWTTLRRSYWKSQAENAELYKNYGSYVATESNISRMMKGLAPIGWDGYSVNLHHTLGIANSLTTFTAVSRTLHMAIHAFSD